MSLSRAFTAMHYAFLMPLNPAIAQVIELIAKAHGVAAKALRKYMAVADR